MMELEQQLAMTVQHTELTSLESESREDFLAKGYPSIVYKYRDWKDEHHKKILTDCEIYLAHPKKLNDPQDCNRVLRYDLLSKEETEKLIVVFLRRKYQTWDDATINKEADNIMSQPSKIRALRELGETTMSERRDSVGVFSVSRKGNITDQWEGYANQHQGFCVGFDTYRLAKTTNKINPRVSLGCVKYL